MVFLIVHPGSRALRAKAESLGSGDFSPLWAGQNASGCKEVPAGQLTRELAAVVSD
jgi:nitronate monooxygenase